jgi:hypothetical protein
MNEFERLKFDGDNHIYGFYKIDKLSNNQTIGIYFWRNEFSDNKEYQVFLAIVNKKKHIRQFLSGEKDILTNKETGKCGLEGLLWGKKQLIEFENSLYCNNGDIICVYWTDNRRRDIYKHRLSKLGYVIGYRELKKCLYKKVNK